MREWASRELQGYAGTNDPIPECRHVPAQIRIDGLSGRYKITGESISVSDLPDFAQGHIEKSIRLPFTAAQLQAAVRDADDESKPLRIALPMSVHPARASTVCSIPTTFARRPPSTTVQRQSDRQ
jgi:hypothetical protein